MIALGAAVWDVLLGEPPRWGHPVIAMGKLLGWVDPQRHAKDRYLTDALRGGIAWAFSVGVAWLAAVAGLRLLAKLPKPLRFAGEVFALKAIFSHRMLVTEVAAVDKALATSLASGRHQLSRVVSRPTEELSESAVREAAIETLAENINDSVVAPLFWYAVGGLPAGMVYRMANTADAMWGYRGDREYTGKVAAVADDILSWVPARISGVLISPRDITTTVRESTKTCSPNGGWPMAAMAGRLNVRLMKPDHYALNLGGDAPSSAELRQSIVVANQVFVVVAAGCVLLTWRRRG